MQLTLHFWYHCSICAWLKLHTAGFGDFDWCRSWAPVRASSRRVHGPNRWLEVPFLGGVAAVHGVCSSRECPLPARPVLFGFWFKMLPAAAPPDTLHARTMCTPSRVQLACCVTDIVCCIFFGTLGYVCCGRARAWGKGGSN